MGRFLNGVLVGIGIGLLVAPMKGEEMRRLASERYEELRSRLPDNEQLKWNYFLYDYNSTETSDHPSCLSDQLVWLREAGFSVVDCFWMQAGHAVYGGYKKE